MLGAAPAGRGGAKQAGYRPAYVRLSPDVITGRRFRVDPTHKDVHR
jgi:hypothetical protein